MSAHRQPDEQPTLESLENRLRHLPQPEVPSGLEDRLLAAAALASPRRGNRFAGRWLLLAGTAALAACLLLAVRGWHHDRRLESVDRPVPLVLGETRVEWEPMSMHLRWAAAESPAAHDEFFDPAAAPFTWPVKLAGADLQPRGWNALLD